VAGTPQARSIADYLDNIMGCHPHRLVHNKDAGDGVFYVLTFHPHYPPLAVSSLIKTVVARIL
jgi:hypothetical protein